MIYRMTGYLVTAGVVSVSLWAGGCALGFDSTVPGFDTVSVTDTAGELDVSGRQDALGDVDSPGAVTVSAPAAGEYTLGGALEIAWSGAPAGSLQIALVDDDVCRLDEASEVVSELAIVGVELSSYTWTLPTELPPGNYRVRVVVNSSDADFGCSAVFTLVLPEECESDECLAENRGCFLLEGAPTCGDCLAGYVESSGDCVPVDCGSSPEAPENAALESTTGTGLGSVATFVCDEGYTTTGVAGADTRVTRRCAESAIWEAASSSCRPVDCGATPTPTPNAQLAAVDRETFGGVARYECEEGYGVPGSGSSEYTVSCTADGTWSAGATCVSVDCGSLRNPDNGQVTIPAGTTAGAQASYSCLTGFTLVGAVTRTCLATGAWSGLEPTCTEVDCGTLAAPANGAVSTDEGTARGSSASYRCLDGYVLVGSATRACEDSGSWSGSAPSCSPVDCGPLSNPDNGVVQVPTGTTFGSVATYSCADGFTVQGTATRSCQASGLWNGSPATCLPVDCGAPPTVTNGTPTFSSTLFESVVTYTCASGFERVGPASASCLSTGAWSTPPTCNDINECVLGEVCTGFANSCTNTPGRWSCGCSAGYTGTAVVGGNATCVGALASACAADNNCPSGSWCPTGTLPELRRCSPRVFNGLAHQMDFMFVPAGSFLQGTSGATDSSLSYTATLTRNYWVSRTEVTQGQWRAASGTVNPSCFQTTTGSCSTGNANNGGPVERIDWYSAVRYANWLSAQNGLQACYTLTGCTESSTNGWYDGDHDTGCTGATFVGQSCTGYRLLTESEWERAARGSTTTPYYWGTSSETATMGQYAWYEINSGSRTQAVGRKLPNAYGLFDMLGNLWEWVSDWYSATYPSGASTNFTGPATGSTRGFRGGSWGNTVFTLIVFNRDSFEPSVISTRVGIRLARSVTAFPDVSCPELSVPTNGRLTATSFMAGATAVYSCDPSYYLEGAATRTCSAAGTWTGTAPTCVPSDTLGTACTADTQCQFDEWCPTSTLPALRRCSPRVFVGQPHQMDFMYIPAGTFQQGTPGATDDQRPYTATLTRNYWVSRTEVTQGQWLAASGTINPSCFQSTTGTACTTSNANNTGPVENLDWYSALRYANWLSSQNGLTPCYTLSGCTESSSTGWYDGDYDTGCTGATFTGLSCTGYRLLTESEWERAARGGTNGTYYWGESTDTATVGLNAWFSGNAGSRTQAAGGKQANAYGLFDMSGNVREWVWDWVYISSAFISYPSGITTDYVGPASASARGLRGGSWDVDASGLGSANRGALTPATRRNSVGFRLARTVP